MPRLTQRLENKTVKALKGREKRYEVRDGNGLVLRVYPNGSKRWYYNYDFRGRRRNMLLGEYPGVSISDAREAHRDARGLLSQKVDPLARQQELERAERLNPTVELVIEEFLESAQVKQLSKRSLADYTRTYKTYMPDRVRRMQIKDLNSGHITGVTDELVGRGKIVAAQRALAHLKTMFRYAVAKQYIVVSPCAELKIKNRKVSEKRVLEPDEIKVLWSTLDAFEVDVVIKQAIRFQLLTMTRRGEVCRAEWKHVDWTNRIWTVPAANSKNGKPHRVPLTGMALEVLRQMRQINGKRKWVFPSIKDAKKHLPPDSVTQAVGNNRQLCGFSSSFNTHDLRRTAATEATGAGAPRDWVKRALNHTMAGDVTDRYDRYSYDKEKRQVLEIWEKRLRAILSSKKKQAMSG